MGLYLYVRKGNLSETSGSPAVMTGELQWPCNGGIEHLTWGRDEKGGGAEAPRVLGAVCFQSCVGSRICIHTVCLSVLLLSHYRRA